MSAAAQLMLKDVLAREHAHDSVRINTLVLATLVRTRSRPDGSSDWITAEDAGRHAVRIASDEGAAIRGRTVVLGPRGSVREVDAAASSAA